ncbi:uncharacterized protein [Littorina saxatilis]|uniref:uncharacterized protein n=1 Tax=Littorina saxatilis TaxID=31220 RepID=UPI0038B65C18
MKHEEQQKESSSITSSASRHFRDPTQPHPPTESQQKSRSFLEKDGRKNPEEQHKENCSVSPSARRRHSSLDQESSIPDSDYLLQRRDTIEERDLRKTTSIIEILDHARHSLRRQSSSSPNPPKPSCQYFAGFASYYYRHHSRKSKLSSPAHKSMVTKTVSPEPGHFGESTANSKTPSKESDRQSVTSKTPSHDSCSVTSRISSFSSNVSFHLPNVRAVAFEPSFEGPQTSFTCPLLVLSQSAPQAQKYDTLTEKNLRQEQTLQLEKNKKSTMKGQQNERMRQSTGVDFTDSDKSHLSEILEKSQKTPDHLPGTTKTSPQSQNHDLLVVEKPAPRHGSDRVTSGRSSPSSSHQGCQPTSIRALLSCVTSPFTKGRNSSTGGKYTGANHPSRYPDAKMAVKKRSSRSTGEVGSPSHQRHPPLPGGNTLTDYRHPPLSGGSGPTDCEQMHPKATSSTCVVEHTSSSNWQSIEGSHSVDHGRQSSKKKCNIQEHNPCKGYLSSQSQLNQQENEGTMSQSPQHNLPMGNAAKTQEQRSIKAKKKEPPSNRKQKPLFNGEKQLQKTKR